MVKDLATHHELNEKAKKVISVALSIVAIGMVVYQLAYTQILLQDTPGHLITHLGFALVVIFLSLVQKSNKYWLLKMLLLFVSIGMTTYLMVVLGDLLAYRTAVPAPSDLVIGVMIILLLVVANWIVFGIVFPIISLTAMAYLIFGQYLPAPFTTPAVSFERLVMWLSIQLGTGSGVYGTILYLSAVYIFLFIFFGGMLDAFGATRFIFGLANWVGSKTRAGPGMIALISSALVGTLTGSTVANVAITGAYTIPMMKKSGYTPEQAAAIESVASNGGQIMPPVMGAAAFLMAGYIGVPYLTVVKAAILPASLYFFFVFLYVYLNAQKRKIEFSVTPPDKKQLLFDAPLFCVPLAVMITLLVYGFTLPFVGFWSIVSLVAVGLASSVRKSARLNAKVVLAKTIDSVRRASELSLISALLGTVATSIEVSGLGIKLPLAIYDLSKGIIFIALLITAVSSILLGMGVPTVAAYILVAVGAVPSLVQMGVPVLAANFFCFILATFSHVTPPVALAVIVASKIAASRYLQTCVEAMKAGAVIYVIAFLVIYVPLVILQPEGDFLLSIAQIIGLIFMPVSLQISISNYGVSHLRLDERLIFIIASLLWLTFFFSQQHLFFFAATALFIVSVARQYLFSYGRVTRK